MNQWQAVGAPFGVDPVRAAWGVRAQHATLGAYHLYGRQRATPLFTENESNAERLWGQPNPSP